MVKRGALDSLQIMVRRNVFAIEIAFCGLLVLPRPQLPRKYDFCGPAVNVYQFCVVCGLIAVYLLFLLSTVIGESGFAYTDTELLSYTNI